MITKPRKIFLLIALLGILESTSIFFIYPIQSSFAQTIVNKNELVNNINKVYNKYPVIKSQFQQEDNSNNIHYGWFLLDKKNGKARIEYNDLPLRIIINNNTLMVEQIALNEKTFTPLTGSPLKYIVNNNINIDNSDIHITNATFNNNYYTLDIYSKKSSFKGYITLIFNSSYYLNSWIIYDETGNTTKITLLNTKYLDKNIPSKIFNTHRITELDFSKIK